MKQQNGLTLEQVSKIIHVSAADIESGAFKLAASELVRFADGSFDPESVSALQKKLFHIRLLCTQGAL